MIENGTATRDRESGVSEDMRTNAAASIVVGIYIHTPPRVGW
jgi:hypothetical protein